MVRRGGGVVVVLVATGAGVGRVVVVPVVAVGTLTGDGRMRPGEGVVLVVDGESSRAPAGIGGVAVVAVHRQAQLGVIGVGSVVVILGMATGTGIGRVRVVAIVAVSALIGDGRMCPGERIILVVDGESSRAPSGIGGVAIGAAHRQIELLVVRIDGPGVVHFVAGKTVGRRVLIAIFMTFDAIHADMRTRQREIGVVM